MPDKVNKVDELYNALEADGIVTQGREHFNQFFFAPGQQGYENRKQLYKALKADGIVNSATYEDFRDRLGLGQRPKPKPTTQPASAPKTENAEPKPTEARDDPPIGFVPREESLEETLQSVRQTSGDVDRTLNKVRYQQGKPALDVRAPELSLHNKNVVETEKQYNPQTGKMESHYLTESGNEYSENTRALADLEQTNIERMREIERRQKEVEDVKARLEAKREELKNIRGHEIIAGGIMGHAPGPTDDARRLNDEYRQLKEEYARLNWQWNEDQGVNQTAKIQLDELDSAIGKGLQKNGAPTISTTGTMPGAYTQKGNPLERDFFDLASQTQSRTRDILHAAEAYANGRNFFFGAAAGIRDAVADVGTWDLGLTALASSGHLKSITEKIEKGKELTDGENALLEATVLNLYISAAYGGQLGYGYEAGQVTGQSLPFMAEMILNPLSGTGNALAKRFGKAVAKRYAGKATRRLAVKAAKAGGQFVGDILGAAGMTATSGQLRVLSDAINRSRGEIQFQVSDGGADRIVYGGVKDGENFAKAYAKAFGSVFTENHSEMVGEYFAPVLGLFGRTLRGGMDKVGLRAVNEFFDKASRNDIYRYISDFEKRAKWNGTIGEFAEEVAGDLEKYMLGTDNLTFDANEDTGIFNGESLLKTFLGVSLMSGFFSAVKTAGYRGMKGEARNRMNEYDSQGAALFGGQWAEIRNALTSGSDVTVENTLHNILNSEEYSHEQKLVAERYAGASSRYKGMLMGERKVEGKEDQLTGTAAIQDSYENGMLAQGADRNEIGRQARENATALSGLTGGDAVRQMIDTMVGAGALPEDVGQEIDHLSPELQAAAQAYAQSAFASKGIWDSAQTGINTQVEQLEQELAPAVVENNGVRTFTEGLLNGKPVLVVADNGQSAVVYQDGKKFQVKSSEVLDKQTYDLESSLDNYRQSLQESAIQEAEFALNNHQHTQMPKKGLTLHDGPDTYQIAEVNPATGEITATRVKLDKNGQLVPDGGAMVTLTQQEVLDMQNQYYEELDARKNGQANAVEPTTTLSPAEEGTPQGGQVETLDGAPLNASESADGGTAPEADADLAALEAEVKAADPQAGDYIEAVRQQIDDFGGVDNSFYDGVPRRLEEPLRRYADAYAQSRQALPQDSEVPATTPDAGAAPSEVADYPRDKDGDLDVKALQDEGDSQTMAEALLGEFGLDSANDIAQQYLTEAIKTQEREKSPVKKNGSRKKAVDFWRDVTGRLNEARGETDAAKAAPTGPEAAPAGETIALQAGEQATGKWAQAEKTLGAEGVYTMDDGSDISGRYVLVEEGNTTPSHDPHTFRSSEGYPVNEQGQNVNSRDYQNSPNAQASVVQMGSDYDGRALKDVPVVSRDGIVWSGNNRTMSGIIAAENGTDGKYIESLKRQAARFGFTPEQIEGMEHPRVVFVPNDGQGLDYTPQTFNRFNAPTQKEEGSVEKGVKMGKVLGDHTFNLLSQEVSRFGSLANAFKSANAGREIMKIMQESPEIVEVNQQTLPRYIGQDGLLTEEGQNLLNAALVGYIFKDNAEVLHYMEKLPKRVVGQLADAMPELVANRRMGEYALTGELTDALKALYEQQQSGMSFEEFMKQYDLFGGGANMDLYGATTYMLDKALTEGKHSLKEILERYNSRAADLVNGQGGLFEQDTRESILRDILKTLGYEIETRRSGRDNDAAKRTGGGPDAAKRTGDTGEQVAAVENGDDGEVARTDNQGNPIDADGRLIKEKVASINDITDEDFINPTRTVELRELPKNVDEAIGANGKPVIIKKSIFGRNRETHPDVTPEQSRDILLTALYSPNLYGQNQKASRPYNWVLISVPSSDGNNRLVLLEVNHEKDNVEIVHWHFVDAEGLDRIKRQAEREGEHLLVLPSDISEEAGALPGRTPDLTSVGKDSENLGNEQGNGEENAAMAPEPTEEGSGLSAEEKKARAAFSQMVTAEMISAVQTGVKPYNSIADLRKRAKELGMEVDERGRTDIVLQELAEDGLVRAANQIIASRLVLARAQGENVEQVRRSKELYDRIVRLYELQPTIAVRSTGRIQKQQYSTPLPMAYAAGMFAYDERMEKGLEPTAGNGMLTIAVPAYKVHANEIDKARLENLRGQSFALVTEQDATQPFEGGRQYDFVIANPPFGNAEEKTYDGKTISGLDPQIALNALDAMKDDGKAVIIIGGNMEYAKNGSVLGKKQFFTYLYDHYNVKGVIDMDGSLYQKQGTTYPTRMILIDGRRSEAEREQSTVYPPVQGKALPKVTSYDELYDAVTNLLNSNDRTNGNEVLRASGNPAVSDLGDTSRPTDGERHRGESNALDGDGRDGGAGRTVRGGSDEGNRINGEGRVPGSTEISQTIPGKRTEISSVQGGTSYLPGFEPTAGNGSPSGRGRTEIERDGSHGDNDGNAGRVQPEPNGKQSAGERSPRVAEQGQAPRALSQEKLPYLPHNEAFHLGSVAPAAMAESMDASLSEIEKEVGSIDEFVCRELGYDSVEEAYNALAAEQMDSVAMAIQQMKHGQALVIGDQTGVGKGRQMAALIRWAVRQGKKPIFFTETPDLFSDIYRDLVDIGSGDLRPFIINDKGAITDSKGNVVYRPLKGDSLKRVLQSGELPEDYDYIIVNYDQVNTGDAQSREEARAAAKKRGGRTKKKEGGNAKPTPKADFLRKVAKDNYMFLDESHAAAGESNTGAYLQSLVRDAKGVTFASATFAKRPDTMPLYALRTAMSKANVKPEELIDIISKGGVTLQEIMSRALSESGQMVRRERDMGDVKTDWKTVTDATTVRRARENYDRTIAAFNAIIKFQEDFIRPRVDALDAQLSEMASTAGLKRGTEKMGVDNVPFANKTYNYTKQLLLALKVDAIVDEVEAEIKAGRHPVIALESTMESSLSDYLVGDVITEPTFSASLLRGLETVMQYTVKDENGDETHERYQPSDLGPEGEKAYYALQDFIRESTKGIFISPLDALIERLNAKGYKVGELTGRNNYVGRNAEGQAVVMRRTGVDKKRMAREFNNGDLDVLILNKSASTGISLHASEKFADQRQRTMIVAQPLSDINDYVQMIGRIDRTGQVHRGYYINLGLPVPAESRFLMMLSTKLRSLNANTTTSQESKSNDVEAPDLLNKYGSQVIIEYLRDNPDIYEKMGSPLKSAKGEVTAAQLEEYTAKEEDASRITGRVALLTTAEQDAFYDDVVKRYTDLIKYLDETGTNDLKITVMPLRAKTLKREVSSEGVDPTGRNPFAGNAYVEEVEMDVLRKPMKAEEVKKVIEQLNQTGAQQGGSSQDDGRVREIKETIQRETEEKLQAEEERYAGAKQRMEENIAKRRARINESKRSEEEKERAVNDYAEEQREKVEGTHEGNVNRLTNGRETFIRRLSWFNVGQTYMVPDNLDVETYMFMSPAIFCGFKAKDSKVTPSTTFAVFATLDGRRRIEVKMSQVGPLLNIKNATDNNWDTARRTNLDKWDSQLPQSSRKKGYIMTGNILQAVSDTQDANGNYPGQLISYTDEQGGVHDGILMPDKWEPGQLKTAGAPISARMEQIRKGERLYSTDGKVSIMGGWRNSEYYLRVPKSKKEGGKFYLDGELLKHVLYGEFTTRRGEMEATVRPEELEAVVNILSQMGVRVASEEEGDDGVRFRTSSELDVQYPTWLSGQTTDTGQHTTQIKGTVSTYKNIGSWLAVNGQFGAKVLDASSGLGVGTQALREMGFQVDDVEPYPSENREAPTYRRYEDVDGEYDVVISNAVLNVIPDDWRADVLKSMADRVKVGGRLIINVRDAKSIEQQKQKIELDSPSEILVTDGKGNIRAYQKGFTKQELKDYVEGQLGEGWKVDIATNANSGLKSGTAVVVTRTAEAERPAYREVAGATGTRQTEQEGNTTMFRESEDQMLDRLADEMGYFAALAVKTMKGGGYSKKQRETYARAEWRRAHRNSKAVAEKLHLGDRVVIVDSADQIPKGVPMSAKKRTAKGWYDTKTGKIYVILGNHLNSQDVAETMLHEAVGHYGLRKLFGKHFDTFLDTVYQNLDAEVRERVDALAAKNNWDSRTAMEEYLAGLAEDGKFMEYGQSGFDTLWKKIKRAFVNMLEALGLGEYFGPEISDNELRYLLWRSYKSMEEPEYYKDLFSVAEDITMQDHLKVGNYKASDVARILSSGRIDMRGYGTEAAEGVRESSAYGIDVPASEYAAIAHQIATYPQKEGREFVFTANNFYLCSDIDEEGNFRIEVGLPIEGNEDLIDEIRGKEKEGVIPVDGTSGRTNRIVDEVRRRGGRTRRVDSAHERQRGGTGRTTPVSLRQSSDIKGGDRLSYTDGTPSQDSDESVRFRVAQNAGTARAEYEATLNGMGHRMRETWQDSMLSLKVLQEAVTKESGKRLLDSQNAWMAENRLSSMNAAQQEEFRRELMEPLLDAVAALGGAKKAAYEDIKKYMIAKHGIERNRVFAQRDGITDPKDYSGLTSLFGTDDVEEAERLAQEYVDQFEDGRGEEIADLWDAVRGVSQFALQKSLDTGMVSQESYDKLLDQFEYYVPLRGWDETTSDEVYDYIGRQESPLANVIKHAEGRKSVADDPLATLQNLAESAIISGNRNMVKQYFLNLVRAHKTNLVSVSGLWLEYDDVNDTWEARFPDIDDNDTPEEVARKSEAFEQRMEALAASDPAHYKRQNEETDIPYRIKPDALRNHRVLVKQGGKTFVLTVNGNPRAAQALNGLTNPDAGPNVLTKAVASGSRWVASWATAKNVGFIASNLVRDGIYTGPMAFVKEGGKYGAKYTANWWACAFEMPRLLRKLSKGTLDKSDPNSLEGMFYDFIHNGGETGFTIVSDVEACKKYLEKNLRGNVARNAWDAVNDVLQFIGRWSEGISRFAAYRTSIEMGRSRSRAIYDAKDISVNFSKKGSGMSTAGTWENASAKDKFIYAMAWMSQNSRAFYSFFNASVQGLENITRVSWHNKGKALGLFGGLMAMGAGQAYINNLLKGLLGGDDDDDYYNLPEWQRSSNFVLYLGKYWPGGWLKLPMPIEFGVPFGLGGLFTEYAKNKDVMSKNAFGLRFAQQIGKALPLDPTGDDTYFNTKALWPTILRPGAEVSDNISWAGLPIANQKEWNKHNPEYKRTFRNAGKGYVAASKALSEATGSTPGRRGAVEINPQKMEYLVKQYFGGGYNWFSRPIKLGQDAAGAKEFEWQDVPVLYRFTTKTDQRAAEKRIDSQFYDLKAEMEAIEHEHSVYDKEVDATSDDVLAHAKALSALQEFEKSERYTEYEIWKEGDKELQKARKDAKEGYDTTEDEYTTKVQMIEAIREYRKTKDEEKALSKYTSQEPPRESGN